MANEVLLGSDSPGSDYTDFTPPFTPVDQNHEAHRHGPSFTFRWRDVSGCPDRHWWSNFGGYLWQAFTRAKSVEMIKAEMDAETQADVVPVSSKSKVAQRQQRRIMERHMASSSSDEDERDGARSAPIEPPTPDTPDTAHNAPKSLPRVLGVVELVTYGVGSTVGAGVFVITGVAASENAGPALVLSFLVAAIACLFSGLCYCEFATRVPVAGSAYTYAYATLGELIGWLIGWNLTLEYGISASAVARAWAGYVSSAFENFGAPLPTWLSGFSWGPVEPSMLAVVIIVLCTILLCFGIKQSATFNKFITFTNVCLILFIIITGSFYVDRANWSDFFPFGINGVFSGAAKVFFSYIGFDAVSGLAEEVKNPQRDLPIGISGTLGISAALYCGVSLVVTGMVPYLALKPVPGQPNAPLSFAFKAHGIHWAADLVSVGSITTLTAATLCSLLGQPRIYMRMAQDGLFFKAFARIHPKYRTPMFGTIVTGILAGVLALLLDIDTLADMISIGTLLAFNMVCAGVLVLRFNVVANQDKGPKLTAAVILTSTFSAVLYKAGLPPAVYLTIAGITVLPCCGWMFLLQQADVTSAFKTPFVPLTPLLGILINTYLIFQLTADALYRLVVWTLLGLLIYFAYGIRHSTLAPKSRPRTPASYNSVS